ncbi:ComEC/Rec2 family competence protein [Curtobacterium sp. MCJR17_043]|uniref:ComEC/Rec2 family competence protein n=1 Tax=Curtobacterium sp. MCJR17_043 TaxID=2175660 RepID=UPI0024DFDAAD|nr:ComEC/Rec2 family competence protein [Curtobacterium sp. MCJR17_043]WIB34765.1 ComEC/Rec2 family competence protein [Curtobacterium sp. MCJR17_043]
MQLLGSVRGAAAVAVVALVTVVLRRREGPARSGSLAVDRRPSGPGVTASVRAVAALVLTAALLVALVSVAVAVGQGRREPAAVRAVSGRTVHAQVRLDRDLPPADRSVVGTLLAVGARTPRHDGLRVPVRIVPALDEPRREALAAGSVVQVRGQLEADEPGAPTAFVLFVRGDLGPAAPPHGLLGGTAAARSAFVAVTADLPEPGAALLRGLAIGDRSGLDADTERAMEAAALTHLTAVSGSNCAVIVALVVLLGRAVGAPRAARAGAAVVVLLGFVVLVRPDPSITRASVMAIVALVVHVTGRPVRGVPLVALAAIGMLVADPWVARSPAFMLSVLATSGIVVLGPPLTELLTRRFWPPVAAAVAVPVAAQIACWPVTVALSPTLPTYAVPANLLAEVLAPVATVVGLVACLLAPLWPSGAQLLATVGWVPAAGIGEIADRAAALPAASAPWPAAPVGVLLATVVCAALVVAVLRPGRVRRLACVGAAVTVVLGVGAVTVPDVLVRSTVPTGWTTAMCDVGQGDATLLRSDGQTALVDTGDDPERLRACLTLLGVEHIDLLVLTHFDRDHVGAVDEVAGEVDIALVGPVGRPADVRVVSELRTAGVDVRRAADGTGGVLGDLRWRVTWPPAGDDRSGNAASIVLRIDPAPGRRCPGCTTALLLGDLGGGRATAAPADGATGDPVPGGRREGRAPRIRRPGSGPLPRARRPCRIDRRRGGQRLRAPDGAGAGDARRCRHHPVPDGPVGHDRHPGRRADGRGATVPMTVLPAEAPVRPVLARSRCGPSATMTTTVRTRASAAPAAGPQPRSPSSARAVG